MVKDTYLRSWWEREVQGWDDVKHPFLDPSYSTPMPAVDCTSFVAGAISAREVDALVELWYFLGGRCSRNRDLGESMFSRFRGVEPVEGVSFGEEGSAVYALILRDAFNKRPAAYLLEKLALVTVGLNWPANGEFAVQGKWVDKLRQIPVMTRLMLCQCFMGDVSWLSVRAGGRVKLRPEMCYGERCYGNNTAWNLHYADWFDCWESEPPSNVSLPSSVTKAVIVENAELFGVEIKKSWKKDRMVDLCRENEALWNKLWEGKEERFFKREVMEDFILLCDWFNAIKPSVDLMMEEIALSYSGDSADAMRRILNKLHPR